MSAFLDENGNLVTVSKAAPLPSSNVSGVSGLQNIVKDQNVFCAHGINSPASAGNLSKIQLWNPSDSEVMLVVYIANVWHTSGTVIYKASMPNTALSNNLSGVTVQNFCAGSSKQSLAKIFTKNDDATSSSLVFSQISIATTVSNGSNILPLQMAILPDHGLLIESTTANMALNSFIIWTEIPLSELPLID